MYLLDSIRGKTTLELINHFHDPFAVFNADLDIVFANAHFYDLFDELNPEQNERLLERLEQCYHFFNFKGKMIASSEFPLSKALRGEFIHNEELKTVHKKTEQAKYYYVSTRKVTLQEDDNLIMIQFKDVTKTIETEQMRKEFIQIAAHELRTPITAIKGFTQLIYERYKERTSNLTDQSIGEMMKELERDETFLKILLDEVYRLDGLTDELLSIFKLEQGKLELEVEETAIVSFISQLTAQYHIPDDFHQIHFNRPSEEKYLLIDRKKIGRVLYNLLSNAIKYSPNTPNIHVWVELQQNKAIIAVQDNGIGIPDDCQTFIFDQFYRGDYAREKHISGYGVGLHICREIVQSHGGDIYFDSQLGKGSTFYFYIPTHT